MIINFIINGNQEDPKGNPLGYVRVVKRALWIKQGQKYAAWKEYVRAVFRRNLKQAEKIKLGDVYNFLDNHPLHINKKHRTKMWIKIYFANDRRCDCDNVFKGLADSLFQNDKYLCGNFNYEYAENGRVEIKIKLSI